MLYYEITEVKHSNGFSSGLEKGRILTCESSIYFPDALHVVLSKKLGNALEYKFVRNADMVRVHVKSKNQPSPLAVTISYQLNGSMQYKPK